MKRIKSIVCGTVGALGLLAMTSCTDLTETIYSDLTKDNYYTDKASVEAAVVRCFEHSDNVTWRGDIWKLQELTADHSYGRKRVAMGMTMVCGFVCMSTNGIISRRRSMEGGYSRTSVSAR